LFVAAVVGVPDITPALLMVSPAGKLLEESAHVNGAEPPVAASVEE
jgi:hypothetical protein